MGRPRKPKEEIVKTITINLQQKILDEISQEGDPKKVIEKLLIEKFSKK